jgi:hypothetical protein
MNPTVQAALIAGGTTAIVGVAGFWSAIRAIGKQIQSAQDARLWDLRATAYVDILAAVDYRQIGRTDARELYDEPEWDRLMARVIAYGSAAVFGALQTSMAAHRRLSATVTSASDAHFDRATEAAADAGNDLIKIIRAELQGNSKPLIDLQASP